MDTLQPWIYEHYKGKLYEVIGIWHHSETLEALVFYRALYVSEEFWENALWVRPLTMFREFIEVDGKTLPRFRFLKKIYRELSCI